MRNIEIGFIKRILACRIDTSEHPVNTSFCPEIVQTGTDFYVMQRCGLDLIDCFEQFETASNRKEILLRAFDCIHDLHRFGYCHNDIKPENIVTDFNNTFLIDYGFVSPIRNPNPKANNTHLVCGTPPYQSINSHIDAYPQPVDDFESLLYSTLYLLTGTLPWNKTKSQAIILKSKQLYLKQQQSDNGPIAEYIKCLAPPSHPDILQQTSPEFMQSLRNAYCLVVDFLLNSQINDNAHTSALDVWIINAAKSHKESGKHYITIVKENSAQEPVNALCSELNYFFAKDLIGKRIYPVIKQNKRGKKIIYTLTEFTQCDQ